jgi:phage/plasmid-associated DNA primase
MVASRSRTEFDEFLAGTMGATVWVSDEPDKSGAFVLNNFKFQTGGQPIRPALKHGHTTLFQPTHTTIIGLNDAPALDHTEPGIPGRAFVVPFIECVFSLLEWRYWAL